MRSAPAAQFTLDQQRESQICVAVAVAVAFAIGANWLDDLLGWSAPWSPCIAAVLSFMATDLQRRRVAPRVRWDTQHWILERQQRSNDADNEGVTGELTAVIDLGPLMVLRFTEIDVGGRIVRRRRHWLMAQRRSMRPQWQAFRRTIYSPRPTVARPEASSEEAAF